MNKTDFLKALSDPTRLKIVQLLNQKQALCVCDIISELDQPQPTISRHLNQLKQIGILEAVFINQNTIIN
ncbi:metalloregulator ArsR/SmtB family transcription factor [Moraxella osloensis]|uniref:ArsR/SmtB family transcription factor n=1 Tax=Faucicola osloensis TaxID=34062 RepID=UPI0020056E24|nr:metalloregulator ArsR/SmtB family transcription factor [Moraxella osloensis]MCK6159567.1 metalloregulator ArsR/SmtB family transcription factor [Moraxella osloensis]